MEKINLPTTFQQRMTNVLKNDFQLFLQAFEQEAPTSIRINQHKKSVGLLADASLLAPVKWSDSGFYLPSRPVFALDPSWHAGAYYVQEASSMFLEKILETILPETDQPVVLDLCAAPGGKSTHISALLPNDGLLVSNEVIKTRANILSENLIKWGRGNAVVTNNDPKDFQRLPDFFDIILIDAPCSGEGMFRKDPESINEWSENNIKLCAERQKRIIADVWNSLREDGFLIYSTCTYNEQENEQILEWIVENFEAVSVKIFLNPDWNIEKVPTPHTEGYRFYPHRLAGEGLFMAVLQKKERASGSLKKSSKPVLAQISHKEKEQVKDFVDVAESGDWVKFQEKVLLLPEGTQTLVEKIYQHLWVVHAGVQVAEFFHHKVNPSEHLALFQGFNQAVFESQQTDLTTALKFLRKEEIEIEDGKQGWILISYEGLPLGWVKKSGNKTNNHYPKEWRLRIQN
jgi:NOL1/NOP2/sun family putative RNA methylase